MLPPKIDPSEFKFQIRFDTAPSMKVVLAREEKMADKLFLDFIAFGFFPKMSKIGGL